MKVSRTAKLQQILKHSFPLPFLATGYALGILLAAIAFFTTEFITGTFAVLPLPSAFPSAFSCELVIFGAVAFSGLTRLPQLSALPIFLRSVIWGYGSLCIYAGMGQSLLYFSYVLGCGLTMIPLCCMARLASQISTSTEAFDKTRLFDYLCRCLFYFGLALLTLPLRFGSGG